jgi:hypothetical protein
LAATKTGNLIHDNNMLAAESARQVAMAAAGLTAAQAKAADIAWARTGLASAKVNGIQPGQFISMLLELGTGGA